IVSTCSDSTAAAKRATSASGIPVVMAFVSDPVGQGLIASYKAPGGNVTGLSSQAEDTLPKMLETLADVLPPGSRVAVLYHEGNPVHPRLWALVQQAGKERGTNLTRIDVRRGADIAGAFDAIARERVDGLLVLPDDNLTYNNRVLLVEHVQKQRL